VRKGSGDNPSKVGPSVVGNMHIEGLSWDSVDRIFHGASWVSNPFEVLSLSSRTLSFDTLDRFQA
jgi:hypothetical protein